MGSIIYRELQFHEAELLRSIERSERIDGIYRAMNGILQLEETRQTVSSWDGAELAAYVARLQAVIASGGGLLRRGTSADSWESDRWKYLAWVATAPS